MNNINIIINNLTNYNKEMQINTMINYCNHHPSSHLCRNVSQNTYEKWNTFFSTDNNKNLFSKGRERLETLEHLMENIPDIYFTKNTVPKNIEEEEMLTNITSKIISLRKHKPEVYFFVIAALIIIFQIFGDGNHRTAQYFLKSMNTSEISPSQMNKINSLIGENDYNYIKENNTINQLKKLLNDILIIHELRGGKTKLKKRIKYKKREQKNKTKKQNKKTSNKKF